MVRPSSPINWAEYSSRAGTRTMSIKLSKVGWNSTWHFRAMAAPWAQARTVSSSSFSFRWESVRYSMRTSAWSGMTLVALPPLVMMLLTRMSEVKDSRQASSRSRNFRAAVRALCPAQGAPAAWADRPKKRMS